MTSGDPTRSLAERFVDVATTLLEAGGSDAVTLRAVGAAAGVSHMAPYRHFADKEDLLAAVAARGFDAFSDALEAAAVEVRAPVERLRVFGRTYVAFAQRHGALYRLMFGAAEPRSNHPDLTRAGARAYGICADTVAAVLEAQGRFDPRAHQALTVATWSVVHGLAMLLLDRRLDAELEEGVEALVERVLSTYGAVFR